MKKTILTITLATLGALVLVMPTLAATTVSFSPASIKVAPGKSFNISVTVNPQGMNNYAEKVVLNYPADTLEVKSFSLGNAWIALTQPDYDLVDNANGVLIKTAGYPAGISSSAVFGTVSFYAKKAGSGTITIGSNSLAFEVSSQSALSGTPVSFSINAPKVTVPKPGAKQNPVIAPALTEPAQPTNEQQPVTQQQSTPSTPLVAAVGGIFTLGTGSTWVGILVGLLILIIIAYLIYTLIQRKKQKFGKM